MEFRHKLLLKILPIVLSGYFIIATYEYRAFSALKNKNYTQALHHYKKLTTIENYLPYLPRLFHYSSFYPSYAQITGELYYKNFIKGFGSNNRSTYEYIQYSKDILKSLAIHKITQYEQVSRHFKVFNSIVKSYDKGQDEAYCAIFINFNPDDKLYMKEHKESFYVSNLIINSKSRKYIIKNILEEKYERSIELLTKYKRRCSSETNEQVQFVYSAQLDLLYTCHVLFSLLNEKKDTHKQREMKKYVQESFKFILKENEKIIKDDKRYNIKNHYLYKLLDTK